MNYKRLQDIEFPWAYKELLELPVFMKEDIYRTLNEFIEQEKKKRESAIRR